MTRRNYSSTAQRTTLSASCTDVATTVTVTAVTGWPASTPYIIIVDPDTVNEEIMLVTNRASLTLTVTRAQGGTTGVAHASGAVVQHGVYAQDFEDANAFLNNAAAAPGPIQFAAGSNTAPAITTSGDSNTGIYFSAADTIDFTAGGTRQMTVANGTVTLQSGTELVTQAGVVGTPAIYPTGDPNTGLYFSAADTVDVSAGGTRIFTVGTGGPTVQTGVLTLPAGSASAPSITASGDPNNGIYFPSTDAVGITTNGSQKFQINSTGQITGAGTSLGAWGAITPTIGSWTAGNGTYTGSAYCQIGKIVHFRVNFTFGSSSSASGNPTFAMPANAIATYYSLTCNALLFDSSAAQWYEAVGRMTGVATLEIGPIGGTGGILNTSFSSTSPFTWATGDRILVVGTYEAA